jgi:hypothetical protein
MSRDQYDVEVEKQRTIQESVSKIFWIAFTFLIVGGCTATEIWGK